MESPSFQLWCNRREISSDINKLEELSKFVRCFETFLVFYSILTREERYWDTLLILRIKRKSESARAEPGGARNREGASSRDWDSSRTRGCGSIARECTLARAPHSSRFPPRCENRASRANARKKSRSEIAAVAFHITTAGKFSYRQHRSFFFNKSNAPQHIAAVIHEISN